MARGRAGSIGKSSGCKAGACPKSFALWATSPFTENRCGRTSSRSSWAANFTSRRSIGWPNCRRICWGRRVEFCTLLEAREKTFPLFVKPAGEKEFEARVYLSASELPPDEDRQESQAVLVSDVVEWEVEYRCFMLEGRVLNRVVLLARRCFNARRNGAYPPPPDELAAAVEIARKAVSNKRNLDLEARSSMSGLSKVSVGRLLRRIRRSVREFTVATPKKFWKLFPTVSVWRVAKLPKNVHSLQPATSPRVIIPISSPRSLPPCEISTVSRNVSS